MAASATLALKAGACVRRTRLVMVAPDLRHPRRSQAEIPLIDLSEFGQPPLTLGDWRQCTACYRISRSRIPHSVTADTHRVERLSAVDLDPGQPRPHRSEAGGRRTAQPQQE